MHKGVRLVAKGSVVVPVVCMLHCSASGIAAKESNGTQDSNKTDNREEQKNSTTANKGSNVAGPFSLGLKST